MVRRLWYQWKAQASWGWLGLLPVLLIMLAALVSDGLKRWDSPRAFADLYVILEVYLPLAAAVMMAGAPVVDLEEGLAEIHLTYPEPAWLRLLRAVIYPAGLWALLVGLTGATAHVWYVAIDWTDLYGAALPPVLALSMAALAGSALARHQAGGILAAAVWWGLDLLAPGQVNKWFYLFGNYRPIPALTAAETRSNLYLLAAACLLLALALAERRERWSA